MSLSAPVCATEWKTAIIMCVCVLICESRIRTSTLRAQSRMMAISLLLADRYQRMCSFARMFACGYIPRRTGKRLRSAQTRPLILLTSPKLLDRIPTSDDHPNTRRAPLPPILLNGSGDGEEGCVARMKMGKLNHRVDFNKVLKKEIKNGALCLQGATETKKLRRVCQQSAG